MTLKQRLNIIFFIVVAAVLAIMGFSFLAAYNIFSDVGRDYNLIAQRLNTNIYALLIVSALTAISGILIFRGLMSRILRLIGELNKFTQNMIQGNQNVKIDIKGSDELKSLAENLNKMADSYKEKISVLENTMDKRQRAVRELAILNELMGFVTSEVNLDVILKNFVSRTCDLIKSEYCAAIIFEPETFKPNVFVTKEEIHDPLTIHMDPEGFFKKLLKDMVPLKNSLQLDNRMQYIRIPELNLEVRDILAVPLIFSDSLSGALILANKLEGSYSQEDEDVLMDFVFQAFQTIAMHEEIRSLAVTDGLTGLNNHRHFQERLTQEVELANRYKKNLSLLILDIDHFKTFNDVYGHQVGDLVLKAIASIIVEQARKTDFTARYGGEEFVVIMPETGYEGAKILAERLRKKITETPFTLPEGDKALVTVSAGFASIPENTQDKIQLIEMADKAMYSAKEHGRNLTYGFNDEHRSAAAKSTGLPETGQHSFENLAELVDSKTPYMKGHSQEVANLAVSVAKRLGLHEGDIESLRIASVLHDIGTVNVPAKILNKPSELTEEEKKIIQAHPTLAELMLRSHPMINTVLPIILYHHERYDGKGYPLGIAGEEIPLHARILAIAEAFHAMISPRPYRQKLSIQDACNELRAKAGSQFDPHLVEIFIEVLKAQNYK